MPPLLQPLLFGVLLPATIACLIPITVWRLSRSPWSPNWSLGTGGEAGAWGGALAIGAAYLAAYVGLLGAPLLVPIQSRDWFPYFAVGAVVLGICRSLWVSRPFVRWLIRTLLLAAILMVLLRSQMRKEEWREDILWIGTLELAGLALWANLDGLAKHHSGVWLCLLLCVMAMGSGLVALLSGSALLGQLAGALAAAFGGLLVVEVFIKASDLTSGTIPVAVVLLGSIWLTGCYYGEVPPRAALLLWASPAAAWIGRFWHRGRRVLSRSL
jgi:hypothetical protein